MNIKIVFTLILFSCLRNLSAQEKIVAVSGKFMEQNSTLYISKEVQRALFIKTKGHLVLPEYGFILMLTKEDVIKYDRKYLVIIPSKYRYEFNDSKGKILNLKVCQLTPDNPFVYYIKNDIISSDINKEFFKITTIKDTVEYRQVKGNQHKLTYTKEWIENIDNPKEVVIKTSSRNCGITGKYLREFESKSVFYKKSISHLAKQQLHYVANLFREIDRDNWTKKQWQEWFENTINTEPKTLKDCNSKNWNKPSYFNNNFRDPAKFNINSSNNQVLRIEVNPNYKKYQNKQILAFDLEQGKDFKRKFNPKNIPNGIKAIESNNDNLYLINKYFKWFHYKLNTATDNYDLVSKKDILPPKFIKNKKRPSIDQTYTNLTNMFFTFQTEDTKEIYIVSLNTKNGETTAIKSITELTKRVDIKYDKKSSSIAKLNYGSNTSQYFITAFGSHNNYYIIKMNSNLNNVSLSKISSKIQDKFTAIQSSNLIQFINQDDDYYNSGKNPKINIWTYSLDLKKVNEKFIPVNHNYNRYSSIIVKNKSGFGIVSTHRTNYLYQITYREFDNKKKLINEKCVYSNLPIEEINSTNNLQLEYFKKINSKMYLFFNDGKALRFSEF
ncbi:hypothetical protein LNI98_02525 [Tenacibaculum dicentrarchi]|nr:hypothetical protein [Tenacibaculum dicentrarchi]MCD8448559.1 hypothetical protein [Tenacibaculum dicentrarchi]